MDGMSRPWAVGDSGKGAASPRDAPAMTRVGMKDFMVDMYEDKTPAHAVERLAIE